MLSQIKRFFRDNLAPSSAGTAVEAEHRFIAAKHRAEGDV